LGNSLNKFDIQHNKHCFPHVMGNRAPDSLPDLFAKQRRHRSGISRRPGFLLWVVWAWLAFVMPALAENRPSEDEVKSTYLFKFGEFVEYPQGRPNFKTFDICVVGNDPVAQDLEKTTSNEHVADTPVRALRYEHAGDARDCAVVYMGGSEGGRLDKDLAALEGSNALTVSDQPQFLEHGGMIQFLRENDHIRFAVNLDPVGRTHFQLSSELLKVAVYVNKAPRREEKR
jgi:YfiR/HmsC-like